ncbi:uncharacterized protein [Cicer arietinum]|uniref:Uncharacterized protein DDB_G0271670 n=1 Tax=Cicer arietinum TaxID=3827 RepID=A0A1S2YS86_CICAR|nr:uncharacterized protein DDB_G0271670 [Cicer arietinum]
MATSVQEKRNKPESEEDDYEEDEEALSLCDLPLSLTQHENQLQSKKDHSQVNETQEEFNFRSWVGLFSTEQEMCVADEVFFQGQIIPSSRLSFSSKAGLLTTCDDHHGKQLNFNQCNSSPNKTFNEFRSNSSTSQNSSTSSSSTSSTITTTTTTTTTPIVSISKSKVRNQFHTHPSPKPQLKLSCPRKSTQSRKSSLWESFRLGVVPTPEIELQDLKVRKNCVTRNSSSSSSNSTKSEKMSKKNETSSNYVLKHLVGKRGGLLSGCDCSIETVKLDMGMIKGGTKSGCYKTESTKHAVKEKMIEWKKQKQRQKQGKKVMSRRRTFEWLKDLHANHLDEEALLSNPS